MKNGHAGPRCDQTKNRRVRKAETDFLIEVRGFSAARSQREEQAMFRLRNTGQGDTSEPDLREFRWRS